MKNPVDNTIEAHRLVGEKARRTITGISRSGWRNLEIRGRETGKKLVPDRVVLTPGKTAWRLAELIEWVGNRPTYRHDHRPVHAQAVASATMAEA